MVRCQEVEILARRVGLKSSEAEDDQDCGRLAEVTFVAASLAVDRGVVGGVAAGIAAADDVVVEQVGNLAGYAAFAVLDGTYAAACAAVRGSDAVVDAAHLHDLRNHPASVGMSSAVVAGAVASAVESIQAVDIVAYRRRGLENVADAVAVGSVAFAMGRGYRSDRKVFEGRSSSTLGSPDCLPAAWQEDRSSVHQNPALCTEERELVL